jgi:hypothetical protein
MIGTSFCFLVDHTDLPTATTDYLAKDQLQQQLWLAIAMVAGAACQMIQLSSQECWSVVTNSSFS